MACFYFFHNTNTKLPGRYIRNESVLNVFKINENANDDQIIEKWKVKENDVTYYYERALQKLCYYIFVKTYSALL